MRGYSLVAAFLVASSNVACGGESRPAGSPASASPTTVTVTDLSASPSPPPAEILAPASPAPSPPGAPDAAGAPSVATTNPAMASGTARYRFPLPPPKATTIALASNSGASGASGAANEKCDAELVAGDAAFEAGDVPGAAKRYEAARAACPRRAGPYVGGARVRVAKVGAPLDYGAAKGNGEISAAVKELRRATQLEPAFGPAHVELGRALLLLGEADAALQSLRRGAELCADEAEAHSALGVALLATGKGEEALVSLRRAAEIDPGSAARHGNFGTVLLMRGRVAEAIEEYELQARLAGNDAMAHSDLGTALLAKGDKAVVARATKELELAVKLEPKRATFHSNLGYALQMQGDLRDAIAQYREAIRLDDKLASAWINLATALAREPKTRGEARAALERARAIDPTDPRVKANLDELDDLERASGVGPKK